MTGTDLRGAKVQAVLAAISEVTVAVTMGRRYNDGTEASEGVEVLQRRLPTRERKVRRHVASRRTWQAVVNPHSGLQRERVKRGWQIGGGE